MAGYYSRTLSAERLRACYEVAPPRAKAYLEAEVGFVLDHAGAGMRALELGCGYGRVLRRLAGAVRSTVGVDTSRASLGLAREFLSGLPAVKLLAMDAARMGLSDASFDLTVCVQNGISAFAADRRALLAEAVRVTRRGGTVLFSSYAASFWEARLEWFEAQAARGLIGRIDRRATGDGVIVCEDGFRATTVDAAGFEALASDLGLACRIVEVASSSLCCEITIP
ncbi:MAG: class I SAM-dependent methyltransferase [Candidatus Eisenbacteria bacterium]|nr:class I SAM-dependent methyltransferase [Candidatus Eisenbacteria bacterium]